MPLTDYIQPRWPAPDNVRSISTTRLHVKGHSQADYAEFNLGPYSGEQAEYVLANQAQLKKDLPTAPLWLQQVHGQRVINSQDHQPDIEADGCISTVNHQVCAVLTADCLPVLLCDRQGTCVAAVHAGWRGLAAGIIQQAVQQMPVANENMLAWLGPAISQQHYAVDQGFYQRFLALDDQYASAFILREGQYYADLYAIARCQLHTVGVQSIYGGEDCTFADGHRFYSYRRDGQTGRQASLIWLAE